MLHALTGDERVRREISEAHEASWRAALAYNLTRAPDGEWRALDGEAILKTYRLAAGYLYEAQLRHELSHRLRLEWTEPVKGMGEIVGVPEEALRAFSTRRQSLLENMETLGTEGFAAARVAALATREAKEQIELPRLRLEWQARAAEHGLGHRELEALVAERSLPQRHVELAQLAARLLAPDGLTATQTAFTMPELVRAVAGSLPEGASVQQVLEVADELARFPGVQVLEHGDTPGRPPRFTTRELLEVEHEAVELALTGRDADTPRPDRRTLLRGLIHEQTLTNDQRQLVLHASLSADRVVCVVGAAGAGKTTALRAIADAHRECDVPVLGAAPSGRAADELQTATGIPSGTLHRLPLDAQRAGGLPRRCVLVVDEAAMAETRVLAPLLELVERADGKAILVGDPAQLRAVGAGGLYPALCERLGTIELTENRRQRDPLEREALARLRGGDPEPYLAHAAQLGRLAVDDDPTIAKQRLLADWWASGQRNRAANVMLAYRRDDVRDLNQGAHALMLRTGRLGRDAVTFDEQEFRVGDQVVCRRNDARLGVRNGTRGTIVDLDHAALTLRDDAGARRELPLAYAAEYLDHGYALTGHAAQGATVDRAYVLLGDHGALRSGATSPVPAPASKPAFTSRSATRSHARHLSPTPTGPRRPNVPPARLSARPPSRSRSTNERAVRRQRAPARQAEGGARPAAPPSSRATRTRPARAQTPSLVEPRQPTRRTRDRDRPPPNHAATRRREARAARADTASCSAPAATGPR